MQPDNLLYTNVQTVAAPVAFNSATIIHLIINNRVMVTTTEAYVMPSIEKIDRTEQEIQMIANRDKIPIEQVPTYTEKRITLKSTRSVVKPLQKTGLYSR